MPWLLTLALAASAASPPPDVAAPDVAGSDLPAAAPPPATVVKPVPPPSGTGPAPAAQAELLAWAHAGVDASMAKGGYRFVAEAWGDCHGWAWDVAVTPGATLNIMGVSTDNLRVWAEVPGDTTRVFGTLRMGGAPRMIHTGLATIDKGLGPARRIVVEPAAGACVPAVVLLFEQGP